MAEKNSEDVISFLRKEVHRLKRELKAQEARVEEWKRVALMATISNGRVVSPVAIEMVLPDGGDRVGNLYCLRKNYIPKRNEVRLRAQLKEGV